MAVGWGRGYGLGEDTEEDVLTTDGGIQRMHERWPVRIDGKKKRRRIL